MYDLADAAVAAIERSMVDIQEGDEMNLYRVEWEYEYKRHETLKGVVDVYTCCVFAATRNQARYTAWQSIDRQVKNIRYIDLRARLIQKNVDRQRGICPRSDILHPEWVPPYERNKP